MNVRINAKFVRMILAERDMTVRDLGKVSEIHEQTIYRLMSGATFNSESLGKLAKALDCNPIDLIEAEGYPAPHVDAPVMATV